MKGEGVSAMHKKFYVISHTHWDREWYYPFEQFRLRLVSSIDELISIIEKEPEYTFYFDAQAAVIEDYLEIRPEKEKLLKRLIGNGNIVIGPWYIQNDFYLSSGETTIRNLLVGIKKSRGYGRCTMVGYAPDQFGNISQLPQILRGFDISSFVFGRGYSKLFINEKGELDRVPPPTEFRWIAPDGSSITAFYLVQWYNNAQRISCDGKKAAEDMENLGKGLCNLTKVPYYLLMNGVDHLEPQNDVLTCLKNAVPFLENGNEVVQAKMEDYVSDSLEYIEKNKIFLPEERGELRYGGDYDILRGCYSSRVKLKQRNAELTARVEKTIEPFASMLEMCGFSGIYPKDELDYVWKLLLLGVTHDAICGCSSDKTCRHLLDRYDRIDEVTEFLLKTLGEKAARAFKTNFADADTFVLLGVNSLSSAYEGVTEATIDLPRDIANKGFELFTASQEKIDYVIIEKREHKADVISPLNLPMSVPAVECKIAFKNKMPPYSFCPIYIKKQLQNADCREKKAGFDETVASIENDFYKITYTKNSVVLTDKRTDMALTDFISVTDEADAGDAYVFNGAGEEKLLFMPSGATAEIIRGDDGKPVISRIIVEFAGAIPVSYDFSSKCRKSEKAEFRARVALTLYCGSDVVKAEYGLFNPSEDHRMKLVFKTGVQTDKIYSDIPFDISVSDGSHFAPTTKDYAVLAQSFAFVRDGSASAAVFNEGNCDYALTENGDISVTLVRSTGVISRPANFSPNGDVWESAKENQQKGELNGVLGYLRTSDKVGIRFFSQKAESFLYKPFTYCTCVNPARMYCGDESLQTTSVKDKFFKKNPYEGLTLDAGMPVVDISGKVEVSALKKREKGSGWILRLFNRGERAENVSVAAKGKCIVRVKMNEKKPSGNRSDRYEGKIGKGKIVTLLIENN